MVSKKSEQISEFLARAADARACAAETTDPARKADLLDIEHCWMQLAKSYRSVEQASRFLDDAARNSLPKTPAG